MRVFFDDLLCCVTSVLMDIPEEHLSSVAVQDAFSRSFFCWKEELLRDHAGTQPQPTNLQVERALKSWSQARRLIKDMLMHATKEATKNMTLQSILRRDVLRATLHTIKWCRSATPAPRFTAVLT